MWASGSLDGILFERIPTYCERFLAVFILAGIHSFPVQRCIIWLISPLLSGATIYGRLTLMNYPAAMSTPTEHALYMREAIRLSQENVRVGGGGPFGAVVVKRGHIIGSGVNRVTSSLDPTAHAEIIAIRSACHHLGHWQLEGCIVYSSCEPCPMCLGAIYWARPAALYFANTREDAADIGFDDALIYREILRPLIERSIPTAQLLRDEALQVFGQWERNPDRLGY